ncbi:MAG: UbiA family prenyltransferase [Bacteroidia bacterium]
MTANKVQKRDSVYLKIVALLSSVRWKNVLFTAGAQYIAFLFAFNTKENILHSLAEVNVHLIIISTALILSGGYIINNFYDVEKDLINRPHRTRFQNMVSRGFKLNFYIGVNLLGMSIALYASPNIFLFFLFYAFALWFYSHKLSKMTLISELTASFLTVYAFFGLVLYFKMLTLTFFLYGASLFLVLFAREIFKDIISLKGDLIIGYKSITTEIGSDLSKRLYQAIVALSFAVDAAFIWLDTKPEFYVVFGVIALLKLLTLFFLDKPTNYNKRILQVLIVLYIIGIVWL